MITVLIGEDQSHLKMTMQATVKVEELPTFLSELEKTTLEEHITWQNILTKDQMIHNFAIAKAFVHVYPNYKTCMVAESI